MTILCIVTDIEPHYTGVFVTNIINLSNIKPMITVR